MHKKFVRFSLTLLLLVLVAEDVQDISDAAKIFYINSALL